MVDSKFIGGVHPFPLLTCSVVCGKFILRITGWNTSVTFYYSQYFLKVNFKWYYKPKFQKSQQTSLSCLLTWETYLT